MCCGDCVAAHVLRWMLCGVYVAVCVLWCMWCGGCGRGDGNDVIAMGRMRCGACDVANVLWWCVPCLSAVPHPLVACSMAVSCMCGVLFYFIVE